ncbi:MAG: hypothetical protein F6K04_22445 [Leptolyngbya sp. SIO4C5]|nr:hypothetical protein [Leptolyngbya sp. SIO4C5]
MNRLWQVFVSPGDENKPLPLEPSPWHDDRYVNIPRGHWELIIDYAKSIDVDLAEKLNFYSFSTEQNNDYVHFDSQELKKLVKFITHLSQVIQSAEPIHPKATEELPDIYENSEYVRMLEAVSAVFQEALDYGEAFRAWIE